MEPVTAAPVVVAAVQAAPVLLDRDATIGKVIALAEKAAAGGERLVWGIGDGSTRRVVDAGFGRLSGLICRENYMPLDPVGHYNRPDVFRLLVDTSSRPAVMETGGAPASSVVTNLAAPTCEPTEA